jgi:hypothetical protein
MPGRDGRAGKERMMPKLSTARETLARLDQRIARETDPKRRGWLTTHRNHWWGEVINDVDMVMATMSRGPIRYTFDGHPFMVAEGGLAAVETYEDTRAMYEGVVALGVRMAGPVDEDRITFDDQGLIAYGILTAIYPGLYLTKHTEPVDPQGFYMARWPNVTMVRFDEHGLMMGEDIINGAPILVRQVDRSQIDLLVDGPLVAA